MVKNTRRSYQVISIELRSQLIFRTLILGHSVLKAAKDINVNYPAAKTIVVNRRKEYRKIARDTCHPPLDFEEYADRLKHVRRDSSLLTETLLPSYREIINNLKQ